MEITPQSTIGQYLKSIDPGYQHPKYKVDFLIRLTINSEVYQFIIEYDGFENHFINKDEVNALNWRSYLTPGDVERECILESYGYKMIRVNRFNLGSDPVSNLDKRLNDLIDEYVNLKKRSHINLIIKTIISYFLILKTFFIANSCNSFLVSSLRLSNNFDCVL